MYCGGDKPIEALWAIKRTFSRLSRTRYEGPRYEIVFPRKLTLDFVSIFAQDDFIFFGFFVSFFFNILLLLTWSTLLRPWLPPLPSPLSLSLSLAATPHTVAAVSLLWVPHFRCHCFNVFCVCVRVECVCVLCVCGSITATIYSRLHCR